MLSRVGPLQVLTLSSAALVRPDVCGSAQPWCGHLISWYAGIPSAIAVELHRLQRLHSALVKRNNELNAAIKPHPSDESGYYLHTLHSWRQQRQEAILSEIDRLQRQLQRLQAAEERVQQLQSSGLGLPQSAYDGFLTALGQQGAQVGAATSDHACMHV
jgi:hypothetical protein